MISISGMRNRLNRMRRVGVTDWAKPTLKNNKLVQRNLRIIPFPSNDDGGGIVSVCHLPRRKGARRGACQRTWRDIPARPREISDLTPSQCGDILVRTDHV